MSILIFISGSFKVRVHGQNTKRWAKYFAWQIPDPVWGVTLFYFFYVGVDLRGGYSSRALLQPAGRLARAVLHFFLL